MSYQVLYRKYRPQKFSDLTGQETTVKILQSALAQSRIAPAYLFSGPRGTGKTTTARIFAKALNCKNRHESWVVSSEFGKPKTQDSRPTTDFPEPCDQCVSCREILHGCSLDVLELDAASHTQVEKIREVIINTVAFAPVRDRYKIFIIDEVHMLSNHSFNALLKTLEEPPPHTVFMLCTTEFHKIPPTITSRCQRYRFLPITPPHLQNALKRILEKEKIEIEPDALSQIARAAGGSLRDALSLLDQLISNLLQQKESPHKKIDLSLVQETLGIVKEELIAEFVFKILQSDAKGVLQCIEEWCSEGMDLSYFLKELRESFRKMLLAKCGLSQEERSFHKKFPVDQMSLQQILRCIQLLNKCADQMRWSDFPRLIFECYAVWLCQPTIDLESLLKKIENPKIFPLPLQGVDSPPKDETPHQQQEPLLLDREKQTTVFPYSKKTEVGTMQLESSLDEERWKSVLTLIQKSKPSLFHPLQTAKVLFTNEKIQISFAKEFYLENAMRNKIFIEETLGKALQRKLPVEFALSQQDSSAEEKFQLQVEDAAGDSQNLRVSTDSEQKDPLETELFEIEETSLQAEELSAKGVEDEGIKNLLKFFPGKLTPLKQNLKA